MSIMPTSFALRSSFTGNDRGVPDGTVFTYGQDATRQIITQLPFMKSGKPGDSTAAKGRHFFQFSVLHGELEQRDYNILMIDPQPAFGGLLFSLVLPMELRAKAA
jgi:hypothetical protein